MTAVVRCPQCRRLTFRITDYTCTACGHQITVTPTTCPECGDTGTTVDDEDQPVPCTHGAAV